jgi:tryptophan synthase beta chain
MGMKHSALPDTDLELDVPNHWLNLSPLLPWKLPLPQDADGEEASHGFLARFYPDECARIERLEGPYATESFIPIPQAVLNEYRKYRPTRLQRAHGLEQRLNYPGRIYFKREDMNPTGSHKPNTAIPQAYYAKAQGLKELVTDTGAGQWGAALAWACRTQGLACTVFMTRNSYDSKPYRRYLMALAGATVYPSPSELTEAGRALLARDPNHHGSLGIGMGEAMEYASRRSYARLALGCMSYYAALHQTVIGQELVIQLAREGVEPDILIGCVGGGTNFIGFVAPFVARLCTMASVPRRPRLIAVESANVPVLTRGRYTYEHADAFGLGPRVKMYTLGRDFVPPRIHAGGLRYHGKSPILSLLVRHGLVEATAVDQKVAFTAGRLFFEAEGVVPAPESAHAIAQVITEVEREKRRGTAATIVFCLSGTGYLDLPSYRSLLGLGEVGTEVVSK